MSQRRRNIRTQTERELAELEEAEQATPEQQYNQPIVTATITAVPPAPTVTVPEVVKPELPASQERKQAKQTEDEDEDEENDELFEETFKRTTYYIRRSYEPKLKKLVRKYKRGPERKPKYVLMEEALEYLFQKYEIE